MRRLLKAVWSRVPLSPAMRQKVKSLLPTALTQPHPSLRRFGTVEELYPWMVEDSLDTRLFLQNYFSVFYPKLDTATRAILWLFDARGAELSRRTVPVGHFATASVSLKSWLHDEGIPAREGTLMWHLTLPSEVAAQPECRDRHAYFTDRGYIAFEGVGGQTCFMHGIDRFAVFQEEADSRFDHYYRKAEAVRWKPEVPLGPSLGCERLEVLTVNRSPAPARIDLRVLDGAKAVVFEDKKTVPPRGLYRAVLPGTLLEGLDDAGCLDVAGLPTSWSRVMTLRRFRTGAVSAMHC